MADGTPPEVRLIPRAQIDPDPGNPRRGSPDETFDTSDLASIRSLGITTPLLVEPRSGRFRIIDGERRWLKAGEVELELLPCIVRDDLTEDDVLAIQLATYSSQPLPPLREAAALERLRLTLPAPATAADVAERLGKPARLVRQRLALLRLIPAAQELLAASPPRITLGLALRIAGLSPEGQAGPAEEAKRRWQEGRDPLGIQDLEYELRRSLLRLRDGGFPTADAGLVASAGACTICPKRSGAQAELFADGLPDAELCTDAKCFEGKQKAQAARVTAAAKSTGVPVIDKPAEVKKLYPYGGGYLPSGSPHIDLDTECDLVRPMGPAPKNEGRRGGGEVCGAEDSDGKHDFDRGEEWSAVEAQEEAERGADLPPELRAPLDAGCPAWATCGNGCGAWKEVDARPGALPRGWKPPTWREALGGALAKVMPAGEPAETAKPKPSLVAIFDGKAHELVEKKDAVRLLRQAGLVNEREAANEIREAKPVKKPGELDKFELERKARAAAEEEAVAAIVAKAEKKPADVKFWRFTAAIVLRSLHHELDAALKRRVIKVDEKAKGSDPEEAALLGWVAEQKEEAPLRGLVIELLVGDYARGEGSPLDIAARFYGVDLAELEASAKTRIKAEAKKKAAEKAKPKGKAPKASPATAKKAGEPPPPVEKGEPSAPSASWECAACGCTYEAACVDGDGECEEVGEICSVCDRASKLALKLCQAKQSETAVITALTVKQKGPKAPETFDKPRAQGVLKLLEERGLLGRTTDKKLLASQPSA